VDAFPEPVTGPRAGIAQAASDDLVGTFREVRSELRATFEQRCGSLSPETLDVVEENMAVIDEAIERIENALSENPGDSRLMGRLRFAYQQEIELLRRVNHLPAEL
jgi:hypothetical protein